MKRKILPLLVALALLSLPVAACVSAPTVPAATPVPTTAPTAAPAPTTAPAAEPVKIGFWKASHGEKLEDWEPIVKEFEAANPNIKVETVIHPWEGWDERYGSAFAAGNPPCVAYMPDEFYRRTGKHSRGQETREQAEQKDAPDAKVSNFTRFRCMQRILSRAAIGESRL